MHTIESGTCKYILDKLHSNKPISPDKTQTSETKNMSGKGYVLCSLSYHHLLLCLLVRQIISPRRHPAGQPVQLVKQKGKSVKNQSCCIKGPCWLLHWPCIWHVRVASPSAGLDRLKLKVKQHKKSSVLPPTTPCCSFDLQSIGSTTQLGWAEILYSPRYHPMMYLYCTNYLMYLFTHPYRTNFVSRKSFFLS